MRSNCLRSIALSGLAAVCASGCSTTHTAVVEEPRAQVQVIKAPGVVEYVWEEPMVDVIDVPPGLDPEGHYYRPAHQSIVEIRQGRWRYYRDPKQNADKDAAQE